MKVWRQTHFEMSKRTEISLNIRIHIGWRNEEEEEMFRFWSRKDHTESRQILESWWAEQVSRSGWK